tara:strand:- start:137 stop:361 length:225 start_codon:yes stop_codon:yes gene_type:complete
MFSCPDWAMSIPELNLFNSIITQALDFNVFDTTISLQQLQLPTYSLTKKGYQGLKAPSTSLTGPSYKKATWENS